MVDLNAVSPEKVVDARGMACPRPLFEAQKAIGNVPVGEILEIRSEDKGAREDIPAWCKKRGHDYLGLVERDGYDSQFVIRRK